jgi:hypothetical protein
MAKIGDRLVQRGLVNRAQLEQALGAQRQFGGRIERHLMDMGIVSEDRMLAFLAQEFGLQLAPPQALEAVRPDVIGLITPEMAAKHRMVPIGAENREVQVCVADPEALESLDEASFAVGRRLRALLTTEGQLLAAMMRYYQVQPEVRWSRAAAQYAGWNDVMGQPSGEPPSHLAPDPLPTFDPIAPPPLPAVPGMPPAPAMAPPSFAPPPMSFAPPPLPITPPPLPGALAWPGAAPAPMADPFAPPPPSSMQPFGAPGTPPPLPMLDASPFLPPPGAAPAMPFGAPPVPGMPYPTSPTFMPGPSPSPFAMPGYPPPSAPATPAPTPIAPGMPFPLAPTLPPSAAPMPIAPAMPFPLAHTLPPAPAPAAPVAPAMPYPPSPTFAPTPGMAAAVAAAMMAQPAAAPVMAPPPPVKAPPTPPPEPTPRPAPSGEFTAAPPSVRSASAPRPRPELPPAFAELAQATTADEVAEATFRYFVTLFDEVCLLACQDGTAVCLLMGNRSSTRKPTTRITLPLGAGSIAAHAIAKPQTGHRAQVNDPAVEALCAAAGFEPTELAFVPVFDNGKPAFLLLGHGRTEAQVRNAGAAMRPFLAAISHALRASKLRSEIKQMADRARALTLH